MGEIQRNNKGRKARYESPTTTVRGGERYETPQANVRTDRTRLRNTEAGLSQAQIRATRNWEESQRNAKTENLAIIDPNGVVNPLGNPVRKRYADQVKTDPSKYPNGGKDMIITHIHPWDETTDGTGLGAKVGISLSGPDIRNAINQDNREKRAVTKNYIYSIKRPANGWGVSGREVENEWNRVFNSEQTAFNDLRSRYRRGELTYKEYTVRWGRVNAVASHRATKAVADKFGFVYTRRKR